MVSIELSQISLLSEESFVGHPPLYRLPRIVNRKQHCQEIAQTGRLTFTGLIFHSNKE